MELQKILSSERVEFDLKSKSKMEVIEELIDILYKDGKITDKDKFKGVVIKEKRNLQLELEWGCNTSR
ncbi:PTS sugar transporter subunit IIA [Caloramator sp. mosi_1]|uniref:PTS sugar transporter subunit IIA n=1 Tax=Caloramator sp. mosi_1 TaxID=3023090 RepID=UPI00235DC3B9|nr:PTS sugar transporter subunit IIA [Caloramator sp. mosi_1]WDC83613.1 PTS sugar transporter subunit IIA [Caloramator sp. mosi_1]